VKKLVMNLSWQTTWTQDVYILRGLCAPYEDTYLQEDVQVCFRSIGNSLCEPQEACVSLNLRLRNSDAPYRLEYTHGEYPFYVLLRPPGLEEML